MLGADDSPAGLIHEKMEQRIVGRRHRAPQTGLSWLSLGVKSSQRVSLFQQILVHALLSLSVVFQLARLGNEDVGEESDAVLPEAVDDRQIEFADPPRRLSIDDR